METTDLHDLALRAVRTRAQVLLGLAAPSIEKCRALDGDLARMTADVQDIADGRAVRLLYQFGVYVGGPPSTKDDPRLAAIERLREAVDVDREELDTRTREVATRIDAMLSKALTDMRSAAEKTREAEHERWRPSPPEPEDLLDRDDPPPEPPPEFDDELEAVTCVPRDDNLVRKVLSGVARLHGQLDASAVVDLLSGQDTEDLRRVGVVEVSTFGVLADRTRTWLEHALEECERAGLLDGNELTDAGLRVMRGEEPADVALTHEEER